MSGWDLDEAAATGWLALGALGISGCFSLFGSLLWGRKDDSMPGSYERPALTLLGKIDHTQGLYESIRDTLGLMRTSLDHMEESMLSVVGLRDYLASIHAELQTTRTEMQSLRDEVEALKARAKA